ncbi:MAG: flagellar basal body rod protein FlgB, partial [Deltaproteobacteria bacterium]|nr:flagellar basal body rod protein FlgB [Deltaproteobacteria bacterium]
MESQGIFNKTFSILEKNLDLRSIKHNLIVSNIANMDTPNYKGFDLIVEEEF